MYLLLIGGWSLYSIVFASATHQYEWTMKSFFMSYSLKNAVGYVYLANKFQITLETHIAECREKHKEKVLDTLDD